MSDSQRFASPVYLGTVVHARSAGKVPDTAEFRDLMFQLIKHAREGAVPASTTATATKGAGGGIKGFFQAQRQGEELRIYVDTILPETDW